MKREKIRISNLRVKTQKKTKDCEIILDNCAKNTYEVGFCLALYRFNDQLIESPLFEYSATFRKGFCDGIVNAQISQIKYH